MGKYPLNTMDDVKKDKSKRSKHDNVTQTVINYLQKRNYGVTSPREITREELHVDLLIDREVSRPNAVMYSYHSSDPNAIDNNFLKFVTWLKDVGKTKDCEDLHNVVGPLFCHLYLEMQQRGHSEKAANFLKVHLPLIDKTKCNDTVLRLLGVFQNDIPDTNGLKKRFRTNKFVLQLKPSSVDLLKKFLSESCHLVMLQVFQGCFEIEDERMEVENETVIKKEEADVTLTHSIERLKNVIAAIKNDNNLIYSVGLTNLKEEATCGFLNRERGVAGYCYSSSIFLKSIKTLKQSDSADEYCDIVLREHRKRIYDISYIKYYNFLVSASQDTTMKLFDLNDYSLKLTYVGHNYPVYCLTTSQNGAFIASGSYDHTARLWSTENSTVLRVYIGHTQEVTSVKFHMNGLYLCTGSADKCIRMWSINDANPVRLFLGSKGTIYSLAFSPDGKLIASAGEDKRLRIWDLTAGKQVYEMKIGIDPIVKLAWSSDGNVLCSGTIDGLIRTWDVKNIASGPEANQCSTRCNLNLNSKLMDIEFSLGSFGCLTAKSAVTTSA